jgi:hypothetical protein
MNRIQVYACLGILVLETFSACTKQPGNLPTSRDASSVWRLEYTPSYVVQYDPSRWYVAGDVLANKADNDCVFNANYWQNGDWGGSQLIGGIVFMVNEHKSQYSRDISFLAMGETDPKNNRHPGIFASVPISNTTCLNEILEILITLHISP